MIRPHVVGSVAVGAFSGADFVTPAVPFWPVADLSRPPERVGTQIFPSHLLSGLPGYPPLFAQTNGARSWHVPFLKQQATVGTEHAATRHETPYPPK